MAAFSWKEAIVRAKKQKAKHKRLREMKGKT